MRDQFCVKIKTIEGCSLVRLYLDLETYRPRKEGSFVEEKLISVGLLIDETIYREESLSEEIDPIMLSEWNCDNETQIVEKVYEQVKSIMESHRFTVISGFNILRFDIPLLICKCVQYSLGKPDEVAKLWNDCFVIDYFQQLLVTNKNMFKGLSLENVILVSRSLGLNPPPYNTSGSNVKELYDKGKFKEIESHLKQDLTIVRWLDLFGAQKLFEAYICRGKALFQ